MREILHHDCGRRLEENVLSSFNSRKRIDRFYDSLFVIGGVFRFENFGTNTNRNFYVSIIVISEKSRV